MPQHVPPRIYRRVAFEAAVRLEFDRFQGFVEQYSANLSLGGMFIRSESPPPVGTEVAVEFRLGDGFELIRGRGRVIWVGADGGEVPGFGLRFLDLTPGSRELIFRLVERRVRDGDEIFDVDRETPARTVAATDDDRLAAPPWDLPAQRSADAEGGQRTGASGAGGEPARFGSSLRDRDEPLEEEPAVVAEPDPAPADAEVSFAGLVDQDAEEEAAAGESLAAVGVVPPVTPAPWPGAALSLAEAGASAEEAGFPTATEDVGALTADAGSTAADAAEPTGLSWSPGEESLAEGSSPRAGAGAAPWPWAEPLEDGREEPGPELSGAAPEPASWTAPSPPEDAEDPPDRRGGGRWGGRRTAGYAAGLLVAAIAGFLLLRTWSSAPAADGAPADTSGVTSGAGPGASAPAPAAAAAPSPATVGPGAAADAAANARGTERPVTGIGSDGASASGPGTIERITWQRRGDAVEFEIAGAGPIAAGGFDHFRVGGENPRLVVRIAGVERPYGSGDIEVGDPLVERVRTGYHPGGGADAGSLHVVFDLAVREATSSIDAAGGRVRVRVGGR